MNHQEDVENIHSLVYKSLKPLMRKCFKDATHLVELLNLPPVYQVETGRSSGMRMFQERVSKAKKNGQYSSKPWITIRFIR